MNKACSYCLALPPDRAYGNKRPRAFSCRLPWSATDRSASAPGTLPRKVYLAGGAGPANVVMLTGSPEPTLIHLAVEILSMHYLLESADKLKPGENPLPPEIQQQASLLALQSLGLD